MGRGTVLDLIVSGFELLKKTVINFGIEKGSAGCVSVLLILFVFFLFFLVLAAIFGRKPKKKEEPRISDKTRTQTQWEKLKDGLPPSTDGRFGIRQFARVDIEMEASFTTDTHPDPIPCLIKDISLSGLGFFSNSVLRKGLRIRVTMPTLNPESKIQSFTVSGELVRITPIKDNNFDYGIHFFHVFKREEDLLRFLIEKFKDKTNSAE